MSEKRKRNRHIPATKSKRYIATYSRRASITGNTKVHLLHGKKKDTFVWRSEDGSETKPRTLEEIKKELEDERIQHVVGKLPKELRKPKKKKEQEAQ